MIIEKKLQSIYFTEVTKQDILSGLDKGASRYDKLYAIVLYPDGSSEVTSGNITAVWEEINDWALHTLTGNDINYKKDSYYKEIFKKGYFSIQINASDIVVSSHKDSLLDAIDSRRANLNVAERNVYDLR